MWIMPLHLHVIEKPDDDDHDDAQTSKHHKTRLSEYVRLFDLILYIPSTIFQLNKDGSSWVEPVLS